MCVSARARVEASVRRRRWSVLEKARLIRNFRRRPPPPQRATTQTNAHITPRAPSPLVAVAASATPEEEFVDLYERGLRR